MSVNIQNHDLIICSMFGCYNEWRTLVTGVRCVMLMFMMIFRQMSWVEIIIAANCTQMMDASTWNFLLFIVVITCLIMFLHCRHTTVFSGLPHPTMLHLLGSADLLVTAGGCSGRDRNLSSQSSSSSSSDILRAVGGVLGALPAQLWREAVISLWAESCVAGARRWGGMSSML